ncbi:hypothetical protein HanPI659440_Chr04g0159521 [Helianthus annuus]|nr:hypothetical protein HanPI659440_Chr04g0159521 [Helianthus annuus]
MVISVRHGPVTSRNGTRNHGLGLCCLWSRVETVRFRLAIWVATVCATGFHNSCNNHSVILANNLGSFTIQIN